MLSPRAVILALPFAIARLSAADGTPVNFSREVLPLLSENCFQCHGPDEKKRGGELRLDDEIEAKRPREGGIAIKPGDPAGSAIIRRLLSTDPDEVMPPPSAHKTIPPAQAALLQRWIAEGAPWGRHWAFEPLVPAPVPPWPADASSSLKIDPAAATPLDRLVALRLQHEGLAFAEEAPRRTLIRRASLDLTGLPPAPEEVAAFEKDPAPDAWAKVVDRLLASPHFGERMAWDWLDAARYADSNGYQGDDDRTMWPWRDWVVDAFNRNLPFDQFTVWQVAGDLIPGATDEQKLATAFLRNHPINGEGGRIPEENRVDYVMDMAETTGTVWLALTLNCCRCHDHKFDPLSNRDYYQFTAFFNQTPVDGSGGNPRTPPVLSVLTPDLKQKAAAHEQALEDLAGRIQQRRRELAPLQPAWEQEQLARLQAAARWDVLVPVMATAEHQTLTPQDDHTILAAGENPKNDTYTVTVKTDTPVITGVRLEALRHPTMTAGGLARSDSGNFYLSEFEVKAQPPGGEARTVKFASASATFEQGPHKAGGTFDGKPDTGWAVWEGKPVDRGHQAVFRFAEPLIAGPDTVLTFTLRHDSPHVSHNLGLFRLSATDAALPALPGEGEAMIAALRLPESDRSPDQKKQIAEVREAADATLRDLADRQTKTRTALESLSGAAPVVMVMGDQPEPRKTFILDRGLYTNPGAEVTAGVPAKLPPLPGGEKADRLALAKWLVAPENPLTARVMVNRFWQQIFGIGLVKTSEDFGVQAEFPKHPELLDWLALEFRGSGWNVKSLLRTILLSRTYRQSSRSTPEMQERDRDNRLLARGPRARMPSWMLRDHALAAAGLLAEKTGGPPVKGYQPAGVWEEATFGLRKYVRDSGESLYRRTLYTFWRRIASPTMIFDNAPRQVCSVKMFRTNTPLHALATLNDTQWVEAARVMAGKSLAAVPDPAARVDWVFRRVLARPASDAERSVLLDGLQRTRAAFLQDPASAAALLSTGEYPRDPALDPAEHAAWTALCLTVLNLDEALTKE